MKPTPATALRFLAIRAWAVWLSIASATAGDPPPATPILGAPPAFDLSGESRDEVRIEAGARLRAEPEFLSGTLTRIDYEVELAVLERRDGWARVRWGRLVGWVLTDEAAARVDASSAAPEMRPAPPPPRAPDARIEQLHRLLGPDALVAAGSTVGGLGPFTLMTDVEDPELLADFARAAASLPDAFVERFGAALAVTELEAKGIVALFADSSDYLAFAAENETLASIAHFGHAGNGLAALFVGDRRRDEVRSLLVHELVHLLSERVLPPDSPTWLVEGLAEDLAFCRVDGHGRLIPGTTYGWREEKARTAVGRRGETRVVIEVSTGGARHQLEALVGRWSDPLRPSLETLLGLGWSEFVATESRRLHYTMSGFFVRYLLADPDRASGLARYLAIWRRGEPASVEDLRREIAFQGEGWARIEADFGAWLASDERRAGQERILFEKRRARSGS